MPLAQRTLVSFTTVTTSGITASVTPTGQQEGDWILVGVEAAGGTGAHTNTAGDLERVHDDVNGGNTVICSSWKKKCGAGESGTTYTFSNGSGSNRRWAIWVLCYSGGDPTDIVESAPTGTTGSSTTLAATGVDPAATDAVHVIWACQRTAAGVDATFTAPTNYTKLTPELYTASGGATNSNLVPMVRALPDANATGDQTITSNVNDRLVAMSVLLKAAVPQVVAVGRVTETETAQALARIKTRQLGQVTETDAARALTGARTRQVARATETDVAQVITPVQTGGEITQPVDRVTETNTARSLNVTKAAALGRVFEVDTAGVTIAVHSVSLGRVIEVDTAGALETIKTASVSRAGEIDVARPLSAQRIIDVQRVTEIDQANALISAKSADVARVGETNTAQAIGVAHVTSVGRVGEVNTARAVAVSRTTALGRAIEVDDARSVTGAHVSTVGRVTETDAADALDVTKIVDVGRVTELDAARFITATGATPVERVTEVNVAQPLGVIKTQDASRVVETDLARPVGSVKTGVLGAADETNLAQQLGVTHVTTVAQVTETDTAAPLAGVTKTHTVAQVTETDTAQVITPIGGAPEPSPVPEVDLMTLAFIVVTGVGQCVVDELAETDAGVPDRVCLAVPGEIAWDRCDCGQFAQTITGDTPSQVFPQPASEVPRGHCGPPLLVINVTASVVRCVPGMDDDGNPPTCGALLDAARVVEIDREALRRAITCCLRELHTTYRITDYTVGATTTVGPLGGCAGVNMTYQFGVNYTCC